ncbi:MAG: plasmid replication protein RepC [Sedimentitalea sp.]|uniref:plasmid replication protein RepC n=1 Tax=Sedimentitalea sp. TaxID=2048915 RepID=UPI00326358D0
MKHTGWRKPTPGLSIAEQLAQAGEQLAIPKNKALLACKRVAAHIGLKASDMMLLDTFGAFTQSQDWEEGRRPIVWASNAYLMEQTGFSLSALKRHARRLVDAGLIAFKDSPNGKRWGHRDAEGHIIEAYGYDLAPLAARAEEFEVLFAHLQAERQLCARAKRQITIVRRTIRAKLETALEQAVSGPWTALSAAFQALLDRLPRGSVGSDRLFDLLQHFTALKVKIDAALMEQDEVVEMPVENDTENGELSTKYIQEMNPKGSVNEPHILNTNQPYPVISNSSENEEAADVVTKPNAEAPVETEQGNRGTTAKKKRGAVLDLGTVMQACPGFTQMSRDLGGYVENWSELHRVAAQVRPMVGVSEHAWAVAQDRLGPQAAAAAMALIFDKFSDGEVTSPGGYLRGMVEKAGAGELHLERSFYGRLSGMAA